MGAESPVFFPPMTRCDKSCFHYHYENIMIHTHCNNTFIQPVGITQTASMVLATSPRSMQGIGIIHSYILQFVDHLKIICDHGGKDTETGKLLTIELDAINIQAGLGGSLLEIDPLPHPGLNIAGGIIP